MAGLAVSRTVRLTVVASHQIHLSFPDRSVAAISATALPMPKYTLARLAKHPFAGHASPT